MKTLNVLLVSYVFPPVGGTGVMRAASLARYLPAEGIRLDVLTAGNAASVADPGCSKRFHPKSAFTERLRSTFPLASRRH